MIIFSRLLSEYRGYYQSQDYMRGVLVEMTGTAIEIVILSITVPLIFYFVHRHRTRPIRFMIDFYLFQIFHKITRMFLDMASINDIIPILEKEMAKDPTFVIFSHRVYGNLDNILFVLKNIFSDDGKFRMEVDRKSLEDFARYRVITERCLEEIDRLTVMLIPIPRVQEGLFGMRIHIYKLRDMVEQVIEAISKSEDKIFHLYRFEEHADRLTQIINIIFNKRRRLIDSTMKHRKWISTIWLLVSWPYMAVRPWVELRICQLKSKPYRDYRYQGSTAKILTEWREKRGLTLEQAAQALGIPTKDYKKYEYGYRTPEMNIRDNITTHLRDAGDWPN
jgi:hypothetical protein